MNANNRTSEYPIDPMFLERWSPRAFTGEAMPVDTLLTMLEAGHWAASSSNAQPWRFIYALQGTERWNDLLGLLVPGNAEWAQHASALVFAVSQKTMRSQSGEERPSPTHSFDTGAACAYMALQASRMGWHAHGMAGYDKDRAPGVLGVPEGYAVEAAFAIGKRGDPAQLSEALRSREKPNDRKPLKEVVYEGKFQAS